MRPEPRLHRRERGLLQQLTDNTIYAWRQGPHHANDPGAATPGSFAPIHELWRYFPAAAITESRFARNSVPGFHSGNDGSCATT